MKTFLRTLSFIGLSILLSSTCFTVNAQRDNSRGRQSHRTTTSQSSSSSRTNHDNGRYGQGAGRPSGGSVNRPGKGGNRPEGVRPGNGSQWGSRPGTRPGNSGRPEGMRPGNSNWHNGGNRPGQKPHQHHGYSHGHGYGYGPNHHHHHRPTPPPHAHHGWSNLHWGRPHRPWCPPPAPFRRPLPPPRTYVCYHGFPTINTILGVALGTAINIGINSLLCNGYTVSGYGNDAVYLSNVPQLNYNWPDATMYFSNGVLSASEFIYSTSYYNVDRYNSLFNRLVGVYGNPYNVVPYGASGASATWWGPGGQFITLQFAPRYATNGSLRYFTTLSFGN